MGKKKREGKRFEKEKNFFVASINLRKLFSRLMQFLKSSEKKVSTIL